MEMQEKTIELLNAKVELLDVAGSMLLNHLDENDEATMETLRSLATADSTMEKIDKSLRDIDGLIDIGNKLESLKKLMDMA